PLAAAAHGRSTIGIEIDAFEAPGRTERQAIAVAARRYGAFLGLEASVHCGPRLPERTHH
ncbi:MAG TPA: hypothetical protein VFI16_08335, partial [Anaeromyxobacteraceae bacterium]|nr:hypothetical protein [Anaeromyxobacteraceae bacterium]